MERSTDKLVDHITQGERACAALDRAVREMRRLQKRPGGDTVPTLARVHVAVETPDASDALFGFGA